jgi:hypothetical protein
MTKVLTLFWSHICKSHMYAINIFNIQEPFGIVHNSTYVGTCFNCFHNILVFKNFTT